MALLSFPIRKKAEIALQVGMLFHFREKNPFKDLHLKQFVPFYTLLSFFISEKPAVTFLPAKRDIKGPE